MRTLLSFLVLSVLVMFLFVPSISAQTQLVQSPSRVTPTPTASISASPTLMPAATTQPDTTNTVFQEPTPRSQEVKLTPLTFMRYLIHKAIAKGIRSEIIVFLLLFPVVASLVAFSRQVVGFSGFSIYAPAALAVVLLSTGILSGIFLFICMLTIAILGKQLISFLKLEYVPRTAMLLWFVAIGVFLSLLFSTYLPTNLFSRLDIFPLLILVLLSEDFMGMQNELSLMQALERSLQMMVLAVIGALIIGSKTVQQFVLWQPELVLIGVALVTYVVGKYLGLRLTEYLRFKPILDTEE